MATTKSPPSRLASQLLGLCLRKGWGLGTAVWVLGGCILPQDEYYLDELPVPRNDPPRIVENLVQPPYRILRGFGSKPRCELEFSIIVEDPNLGDTLTAYWYVDYDPNQPRGADREVTLLPKGDDPRRDERPTIKPIFNSAEFSRLNTPGDHVVEVVVADRALQGRVPQADIVQLPNGDILTNPGYATSYVWFVRTEQGNCP
ncbi:hypothetical protein CYFUS_005527 [Cystobacter fuscus]|uniref:Uncharacterized protein n=1 Tax=Cystobacter fuscus TaxID=43 RepID=A0A250J831_9BACT|nr:hypothetical protein CYFUS_005527 [Cystobacter fuscus]